MHESVDVCACECVSVHESVDAVCACECVSVHESVDVCVSVCLCMNPWMCV